MFNNNITNIIKEVYNDVLLRDPDQSGYETYTNQIKSGMFKYIISEHGIKDKLRQILISSDEYITLCGLDKVTIFLKTQTNSSLTCNCKSNTVKVKKYWNTVWYILHIITYMYPNNPTLFSQKRITRFFNNFSMKISCNECRKHYIKYIENNPILNIPNNKNSYIKWLIDLHNDVNIRLNKQIITYEIANRMYNVSNPKYIEIIIKYDLNAKKLFGKLEL